MGVLDEVYSFIPAAELQSSLKDVCASISIQLAVE
jgi:hypothetical protein